MLIKITGKSHEGKTNKLITIAEGDLKSGNEVLFITTEESSHEIHQRFGHICNLKDFKNLTILEYNTEKDKLEDFIYKLKFNAYHTICLDNPTLLNKNEKINLDETLLDISTRKNLYYTEQLKRSKY